MHNTQTQIASMTVFVCNQGLVFSTDQCNSAVRQRCVTALASVSSQLSVVQESAPVLLQMLALAQTGTYALQW